MKKQKTMSEQFSLAKRFVKVYPSYIGANFRGTAQCLGLFGEALAAKTFESLGLDTLWVACNDCGYDLLIEDCLKVEVKTARRNKRGMFQFCLSKTDHADITKSDLVMLQCVENSGIVTSFIVPTNIVANNRQITISSNLETYKGIAARYKLC